jgi:hypothetical protein
MDIIASRRLRRAPLCVLIGVLLFTATTAESSGATTGKSGSQILAASIAEATKERFVHVTVHFYSGNTTGVLVEDSAPRSGEETVAIGNGRVSIVLFDDVAYFSGNRQGLRSYFGLPSAIASNLAGQWVSVRPADSGFQSVTAGLTLPAALKEASPTGTITKSKSKVVKGQQTVSISGTSSASGKPALLFVATKGKPLPVEVVSSGGSGHSASGEIVTFSRWGKRFNPPSPAESIPISSISAASSASG